MKRRQRPETGLTPSNPFTKPFCRLRVIMSCTRSSPCPRGRLDALTDKPLAGCGNRPSSEPSMASGSSSRCHRQRRQRQRGLAFGCSFGVCNSHNLLLGAFSSKLVQLAAVQPTHYQRPIVSNPLIAHLRGALSLPSNNNQQVPARRKPSSSAVSSSSICARPDNGISERVAAAIRELPQATGEAIELYAVLTVS